jgi:hypothetical protein
VPGCPRRRGETDLGHHGQKSHAAGAIKVPDDIAVVPKKLDSFDEDDQGFFLALLPGPYRADGLPESLFFWKRRIEEFDGDRTFRAAGTQS